MLATEIPKESTFNPTTGSTGLAKLRALIADDGFAATFQTMGRYRTALLQVASALAQSPASNVEPVVTDHSVDADEMVGKQAHGYPTRRQRASAIVRWVTHVFSTIAEADAAQRTPVNLSFERNNFNRALSRLQEASALLSALATAPQVKAGSAESPADEPGTLAELTWCIEHGCHGPRTYRALVNAREQLLVAATMQREGAR